MEQSKITDTLESYQCASQIYRATDLATGTSEGTGQVCVWQGDMTRALDVSVCVCARGWGEG